MPAGDHFPWRCECYRCRPQPFPAIPEQDTFPAATILRLEAGDILVIRVPRPNGFNDRQRDEIKRRMGARGVEVILTDTETELSVIRPAATAASTTPG